MSEKVPKIMTKPLPEILDELEGYIQRVEESVKQAQEAADKSKSYADEAKNAGLQAAAAAQGAAEAAVAKVAQEAQDAIKAVRLEMDAIKKTAQEALKLAQASHAFIVDGVKAHNLALK